MKQLNQIDILTIFVITLFAVYQGEVTVFYIVYLFWFQEWIRTVVDFLYLFWKKNTMGEKFAFIKQSFGSFFILYVYVVFILSLFGLMLNWGDSRLLGNNLRVFLFKNWYFNINIILFGAEYIYFRMNSDNRNLTLPLFSRRHIILHISIILGALIQLSILPRLNIRDSQWISTLIIVPFLLLKILLGRSNQYH